MKIWEKIIKYQICLKCSKNIDKKYEKYIQFHNPYCYICKNSINEELKQIRSNRMNEMREKLAFLNDIPGGWKTGDVCHICSKNYENIEGITTYTYWFGARKKICTYCFHEECKSKGLY